MTVTITFASGKTIELTEQEFKELYGNTPQNLYPMQIQPWYPNAYPNYPIITYGGSTCH
jgi:hypothetical protein